MGNLLRRLRRRKRQEEVEGLESFDTLEGDSKVQSQFKFPTGKGRLRLSEQDEDEKSFLSLELETPPLLSMEYVSEGRRKRLEAVEGLESFDTLGRRKRPEAVERPVEGMKSCDTLEGDSKVQSQFKSPTGKGSKSRPRESSIRYAVIKSRAAKPEYWTPYMRPEGILKADEKKDEEEADDGNGRNVGEEVTEGGEQLSQQLHEVQTEEQQHLAEEEANKIRVYEGQVTSEGTHLDLKLGAVHLTFPPDAVSEPTSIVVYKWKSSACSPQLQEHEAIVSNVIEISATTNEVLQFKVGVKLFFSHCAPYLQGYELVIKRLINKETNDWKEVEGTVDARQLSDIEDEYPKEVPDFSFPVVQADIAECSIFTVICRLIPSPTYTISSRGGCFNHPDYPGVAVTVPKKAVSVKLKFPLHFKVQEVPDDEFKDGNVYVGPILRISCTQGIEFLKPVTIQLPVAPRGKGRTIPDPSTCRVRVLFLRSDGENKEWVEITDELENPARFDGTSVTFQVKRFSG